MSEGFIARLAPGVLWVKDTATVGIAAEIHDAITSGRATEKQYAEAEARFEMSKDFLERVAIPGAQWWMSPKRMRS